MDKKYYTNEAGIDYEDLSDLYIEMSDFPDIANKDNLSKVYCEDENQEQVKENSSNLYDTLVETTAEVDSKDKIKYVKSLSDEGPGILDRDVALNVVSTEENGFAPGIQKNEDGSIGNGQMTNSEDKDSLILIYNSNCEDGVPVWKTLPDTAWQNTSVSYDVTVYRNISKGGTIGFNLDSKFINDTTSVYVATYTSGSDAVITAVSNTSDEYVFSGWYTMSGAVLTTNENYYVSGNTITIKNINDNLTIEARFKPADYIISFDSITNGVVSLNGIEYTKAVEFERGSSVEFTSSSIDPELYYFSYWVINGVKKNTETYTISSITSSYKNCSLVYTEYARIYVNYDDKHKNVWISVNNGTKTKINSGDKTVCKPGDKIIITSEMISSDYLSSYESFTAESGEKTVTLEAKEKAYQLTTFSWNENFINSITITQSGDEYTPYNGEAVKLDVSKFSITVDKEGDSVILNNSDQYVSGKTNYYIDAEWETVDITVNKNSNAALYISKINYIAKDNSSIDKTFTGNSETITVKVNSNIEITCSDQGNTSYELFLHNYLVVDELENTNYDLTTTPFSYSIGENDIFLSVSYTYCSVTYYVVSGYGGTITSDYDSSSIISLPAKVISNALKGDKYTFTATGTNGGYSISNWMIDNSILKDSTSGNVITDSNYTLTVTGNHDVSVTFSSIGSLTINVRTNNNKTDMGTISVYNNTSTDTSEIVKGEDNWSNSSVSYGTEYKLSATSNEGYKFKGWSKNGSTALITGSELSISVTENNLQYVAFFEPMTIRMFFIYTDTKQVTYSIDFDYDDDPSEVDLTSEDYNKFFKFADNYEYNGYYTGQNKSGSMIVNSDKGWEINTLHDLVLSSTESTGITDVDLYINLYAYLIDVTESKITLNYNGGKVEIEGDTFLTTEEIKYNSITEELDSPKYTPIKEGYTFNGNYNTESDGSGEDVYSNSTGWNPELLNSLKTSTDSNVKNPVYYAQYTTNKHELTWNLTFKIDDTEYTGKIDSSSSTYTNSGEVEYGTAITFPQSVSCDGFTFSHWEWEIKETKYTTDATDTIATLASSVTMPDDDLTISAVWKINTLTIERVSEESTDSVNYGWSGNTVNPSTASVNTDDNIIKIDYGKFGKVENPFKKRLTITLYNQIPKSTTYSTSSSYATVSFINWFYNDKYYLENESIDSSDFVRTSSAKITFTAQWDSKGCATVPTESNDGNYKLLGWSPTSPVYNYGSGTPSTTSYTLVNKNEEYYVNLTDSDPVTILKSVYEGVPCTLSYNVSWDDDDEESQEQQSNFKNITTYKYGDYIGSDALSSEPSRTGYNFNGWYTAFSLGDKVGQYTIINNLSYSSDHLYNIYAQWSKIANSYAWFSISYDSAAENIAGITDMSEVIYADGVEVTTSTANILKSFSGSKNNDNYEKVCNISLAKGYCISSLSMSNAVNANDSSSDNSKVLNLVNDNDEILLKEYNFDSTNINTNDYSLTSGTLKSYWSAGGSDRSTPSIIHITVFKIPSYKITWTTSDGVWSDGSKDSKYTTVYVTDTRVSIPDTLSSDGYELTGWQIKGTSTTYTISKFNSGNVTVNSDTTFIPVFVRNYGTIKVSLDETSSPTWQGYIMVGTDMFVGKYDSSTGIYSAGTGVDEKTYTITSKNHTRITVVLTGTSMSVVSEVNMSSSYLWDNPKGTYELVGNDKKTLSSVEGYSCSFDVIPYDGTSWYDGSITLKVRVGT